MAGQRRAQYVSIPLGPGVLSNTTGRGARTRINYMNWDRWHDSTWVRWHKLMPEKQGGWQYQALTQANPPANAVPPSGVGPLLLLHLDETPVAINALLLLHFDGPNNSTMTVDSSVYANPVTINGAFGSLIAGPYKFGTASLHIYSLNSFNSYVCKIPLLLGGPLDVFATDNWTIECFFHPNATAGQMIIFDYGVNDTTPIAADFAAYVNGDGAGNYTVTVEDFGMFGADTHALATTVAFGVSTWHHLALVNEGGLTTAYLDGVAFGSYGGWNKSLYANPNVATYVLVGSFPRNNSNSIDADIDEFAVWPLALYTANFTPPTAPFDPSIETPGDIAVDSSLYDVAVTGPNGMVGAYLDTSDPLFGSSALNPGTMAAFETYALEVPYAMGSLLDIFATAAWTVECFFLIDAESADPFIIVDYGGLAQAGAAADLVVFASLNLDGVTGTVTVFDQGAFGTGLSITANNIPMTAGTYHHFALVHSGSVVKAYLDGNLFGTPMTTWLPGNYTYVAPAKILVGSSNSLVSARAQGLIDEFSVWETALYLANFTPPIAPVPPVVNPAVQYLGVARGLKDWSSIDGQYWIAIGTSLKLYLVNQGQLYDITPDRKTSNVVNPFTTINGVNYVTVTDPGHQANTGDFIDITGATEVGGLTLDGDYQLTVVDPNTYTIVTTASATAGATGGGNVSIAYEISTGLPQNGQLLGYGTGLYGAGTYGTARAVGTGVFARMRTWSLDNYGQDLIASYSDGEIYWWQKNNGPNSPAAIIPLAPTGCQRVLVDAQQRVIIALGCTDETSVYDAMLLRWCSFDDITDWVETDINTAGSDLLTDGSRIVTGLKTKGQNLIFTDTAIYRMVFVGQPDIYDCYPAGRVQIVGPNACVDVDGVAYLMGFDNIYTYSGTLMLQACDVWETVFNPHVATSLLRSQSEGVVCFTYEPKTEVTWLYPSIGGGALPLLFAPGGLDVSQTEAELAVPWGGSTGYFNVEFSDQESQSVFLTAGETLAAWALPLTQPVTSSAIIFGNDRYVTFNWEDGSWYYGAWNRTCAQGRAEAMGGFPYGVNAGFLYQHEVGTDAIEAFGTQAIGWYMKSLDITVGGAKSEYTMGGSDARFAVGGSDAHLLMRSFVPDWFYMTGEMNLTIMTKDRPQDPDYVIDGPVAFDSSTAQIDIDAHGSQLVIQFDNYTAEGGLPSLGSSFRQGIMQGLAVPYAKR